MAHPFQLFRASLILAALLNLTFGPINPAAGAEVPTVRVATYNTSMFRDTDGQLGHDLENGDNSQAKSIAEVIERERPDVILLNEFDFDPEAHDAKLFLEKYLAVSQNGCEPIIFSQYFTAAVNTGVPSGRDLNHDGELGGPNDAFGYGKHPGQYGMLVLSRYPILKDKVRTFQNFLWRDMPGAMLPVDPQSGLPYYDEGDLAAFRLSSKSHWDVPIRIPASDGSLAYELHLLCAHPTPPVFDGPEDRNGHRNHDEIRFWADYIDPSKSEYIVDDNGNKGGLPDGSTFVVVGDLNCDPIDGEGLPGTMDQLLKNARIDSTFVPSSPGGPIAVKANGEQNVNRKGDPSFVTSDFGGEGHGNFRLDYVLPSKNLKAATGGIFWPLPGDPGATAIAASDHRSVWLDLTPAGAKTPAAASPLNPPK
jgi:endonuclease/exonuclease/phosphatase family metal-dependent hydrolase